MFSSVIDPEVLRPAIAERSEGLAPLGAHYLGDGRCSFLVWAPKASKVEIQIVSPGERVESMSRGVDGYHSALLEDLVPGTRYFYRLDNGEPRPDPASRHQPDGVHGPSEVVDPSFDWTDTKWFGLPFRDYVIYELHVGTATPEGTFDSTISLLPGLKDLGVTALELMPVNQFPGTRNWGYDGVLPFAVQNSYGGPEGLKRLVNACHENRIAVVLDVVYNHIGPEGNYLPEFGPYFTNRYRTPWGAALNFDAEHSNHVRRYFLENALRWQNEFHIDALRLDAVHAIRDFSATPFLQQLARAAREQSEVLNRRFFLIAESDLNDPKVIRPEALGGFGLDAQWSDDFHHVLHVLLTEEREGYYADFGGTRQLAKFYENGYVYTGQYSAHRKCNHGAPPDGTSAKQFVVYSQNHDQIGNRLLGDRLTQLISFEKLKLAAGAVLLSPFVPLLFMGEEYGETAPFQYIVSHTDAELLEAVRKGRREEFASFEWGGEMPDPGAESTFHQCRLNPSVCLEEGEQARLKEFYRTLISLRRTLQPLARADKNHVRALPLAADSALAVIFQCPAGDACALFNFRDEPVSLSVDLPAGEWQKVLDSADVRWAGPGSQVPDVLTSNGTIEVQCAPTSVLLLQLG